MAFRFSDYGTNSPVDLTLNTFSDASAGALNSYARVTAISGNEVTINKTAGLLGAYEDFSVGVDVLFHVSATAATTYKTYLGCYLVATIIDVTDNVITLDKDVTGTIPVDEFGRYYCQLITIARFDSLSLSKGVTIVPPAYTTTNFYGGIVAIKCFGDFNLNGGHINLSDRGLPIAAKTMRPLTSQEEQGTLDTDTYSGWENSQTKDRFLLNVGDGAAFILVKGTFNVKDSTSRIGNPATLGAQFCRGAADSVGDKPSDITNIGGSTILLAAQNISSFSPAIIAKYRAASSAEGQGICRCYIASDSKLRNDEGLYAYDNISNPGRLLKELNIRSFGNGSHGDFAPTANVQVNNYAKVTAINDRKVTYTNKTTDGVSQITRGALVMIHVNHKETPPDDGGSTAENIGRFVLANVLEDNGSTLTLDYPAPKVDPSSYVVQVISIPQFSSVKTSSDGSALCLPFDGEKGGVVAIACSGEFNGTNFRKCAQQGFNREPVPYSRGGLRYIGNAQMYNRLPIGAGLNSFFILAKSLHINSAIGTSAKGTEVGFCTNDNLQGIGLVENAPRGYRGGSNTVEGYVAGSTGGSGASGGEPLSNLVGVKGGYGSNGENAEEHWPDGCSGRQGCHVFIVADTITKFSLDSISTGGIIGDANTNLSGGAGYGGGPKGKMLDINEKYLVSAGGYNGGGAAGYDLNYDYLVGGGSSGWAFIYANKIDEQQRVESTVLFD